MNKILLVIVSFFVCSSALKAQDQFTSEFSQEERMSLLNQIAKGKEKDIYPFDQLYKNITPNTNIVKIENAEFKDVEKFDYSKDPVQFLNFWDTELWLYKVQNNKGTVFAITNKNKHRNYDDGLSMPFGESKILTNIKKTLSLSKLKLSEVQLTRMTFLPDMFLIMKGKIYVVDKNKLIAFNEFYKKKYTLREFQNILLFQVPESRKAKKKK